MSNQAELHLLFEKLDKEQWPEVFNFLGTLQEKNRNGELIFSNTEFPLYPSVVIVGKSVRAKAKRTSELLINLLERVITICRFEKEALEFFMLNEDQKKLCLLPAATQKEIIISRFDTLFNKQTGDFKIIENNTDCPAGVIFTGRIMRIMSSAPFLETILAQYPVNKDPITLDSTFVRHLLAAYDEFDGTKIPNVAILQLEGKASPETVVIRDVLLNLGVDTKIIDPTHLSYENNVLHADGFPVNLIWNKINTVYFEQEIEKGKNINPLFEAVRDRNVCHLNSFASRYITESKICHAFLWHYGEYFTKEEQSLIHQVIPWSVKMEQKKVEYQGETHTLLDLALNNQANFVLKAAYDIRGDGVSLGRSCSPEEWGRKIGAAMGKPYILQEYVPPSEIPVVVGPSATPQEKKFSADMFMFGGKFQGFGSKVSDNDKLNIFQGGSKNAIFSI